MRRQTDFRKELKDSKQFDLAKSELGNVHGITKATNLSFYPSSAL